MEQPNIDDRIEAMRQQLELLTHMQQTSEEHIDRLTDRIDKLTATVEKHEADWERVRRSVRAALTEWFSDNGEESGE